MNANTLLPVFLFCFLSFSAPVFAQNLPNQSSQKREKKPKEKIKPLTGKVFLVEIDGLRLEDLKNQKLRIPVLKTFFSQGAAVLNVESVYPSQGLPAQATILTGMFPSDHGVTGEYQFDEKTGRSASTPYQLAAEIKTDSLWQAAKREGRTTTAINFPFGDLADNNLKSSDQNTNHFSSSKDFSDLTLFKFDAYENVIQKSGLDSAESNSALENIDSRLKSIFELIEKTESENGTTILIVSSHGYSKVEQIFFPNAILAKKGFLSLDAKGNVTDWIVTTRTFDGSAAIYLKDQQNEQLAGSIKEIFEEIHQREASPIWRIISKKDAAKLGADPRAAFFIEASPQFVISEQISGKKNIEKINGSFKRAISGYVSSRSEMRGLLLARGKAIKPGTQVEYARLVDLAPTIARLLGFELKAARGHAISDILMPQDQK